MSDCVDDATVPTIADVAALIRARTKDRNGNEIGTFNPDTRPTDDQVGDAIAHAVASVHQKVGAVGSACADIARLCAAYGAAAEIELSYFPEQQRTDRSPYDALIARWQELLEGVRSCVLGDLPGTDAGTGEITNIGEGTINVVSGVVNDYYTGETWPAIVMPPAPAPAILERDDDDA